MDKKIMLLVNPHAGKGGYKSGLTGVIETFCKAGWQPTVYFTRASGEAPNLVERYAPGCDMVVCMGGDGTLSEVAGGVMRLEERLPIGYIPLGTANDVAHTLGISPKPSQAAKAITQGRTINYDLGRFGEKDYFTYVAAFGAFTDVSYETPQEFKHALGHLAYMLEGMRRLTSITGRYAKIEYDGGVVEDEFIFGAVTNSTSVAGVIKLDSDAVALDDGLFEMLLVKKPQDIIDIGDIVSRVLSNDFSGPNVMFEKTKSVRIKFREPVAWTRDGEDGGMHSQVEIVNIHPGVRLVI